MSSNSENSSLSTSSFENHSELYSSDSAPDFGHTSGGKNSSSPITGIIEEKLVIVEFGNYQGTNLADVARYYPAYYRRLVELKEQLAIRRHKDKSFRLYVNPLSEI